MRLRKVKTIREANIMLGWYLPGFNKRFSFPTIKKGDLHRKFAGDIKLDKILCKRYEHVLRNDFTVAHNKKLYQILKRTNANKVTVEGKISGKMLITHKDEPLKVQRDNPKT